MNDQFTMTLVLFSILLVCGYLLLYLGLAARLHSRSRRGATAAALLVLYASVTGGVIMILRMTGSSWGFSMMAALLLLTGVMVAYALYSLLADWRSLRKGVLALLAVYLLVMGYITVFSREEGRMLHILLHFDAIRHFLQTHKLSVLRHFGLNIVLFIPMGLLLPMLQPKREHPILHALLAGAVWSAGIEALQLVYQLGLCDVEDLLANILGAGLGGCLYALIGRRFSESV